MDSLQAVGPTSNVHDQITTFLMDRKKRNLLRNFCEIEELTNISTGTYVLLSDSIYGEKFFLPILQKDPFDLIMYQELKKKEYSIWLHLEKNEEKQLWEHAVIEINRVEKTNLGFFNISISLLQGVPTRVLLALEQLVIPLNMRISMSNIVLCPQKNYPDPILHSVEKLRKELFFQ